MEHLSARGARRNDSEGHELVESLRAVDAELAASIERLERVRTDLPMSSGTVSDDLSEVDRAMLMIYAQVLDDSWPEHLQPVSPDDRRTDADNRFQQLDPADDVQRPASRRPDLAGSTVLAALREIYDPAQIDVLERAYAYTAPGAGPHTGARPTSTEASP